jgi:hypothetical protein
MPKLKQTKIKMSNATTDNFCKVFNNLEPWTPPVVSFRLYYNDNGWPICYSMEDLPGNYIELDAETYQLGPTNARVVDGKLTIVKPPITILKLVPNQPTGIACDPRDVTVVVDSNKEHVKWSIKAYEV